MTSRVAVAAWIGSRNAGDELLHAGLRRWLSEAGLETVALSIKPAETEERFGGRAASRWLAPLLRVDGLILGGGGILQDETSPFNLPYHLEPSVAAALRRVPQVALGIGAGPLRSRASNWMVKMALRPSLGVATRDEESATLLADLGVPDPVTAADLALHLPIPRPPLRPVLLAALRPWRGAPSRIPVAWRRREELDESVIRRAANALDLAAQRSGLGVELAVFDAPKDLPFAAAVQARMRLPAAIIDVPPLDLPAVIAGAQCVLAMRYHAAVLAAASARPTVLLGYSRKVIDLGSRLRSPVVDWRIPDPSRVAGAVLRSLASSADQRESVGEQLRSAEERNGEVLNRLLDRIG